jgi:hypothetical protein
MNRARLRLTAVVGMLAALGAVTGSSGGLAAPVAAAGPSGAGPVDAGLGPASGHFQHLDPGALSRLVHDARAGTLSAAQAREAAHRLMVDNARPNAYRFPTAELAGLDAGSGDAGGGVTAGSASPSPSPSLGPSFDSLSAYTSTADGPTGGNQILFGFGLGDVNGVGYDSIATVEGTPRACAAVAVVRDGHSLRPLWYAPRHMDGLHAGNFRCPSEGDLLGSVPTGSGERPSAAVTLGWSGDPKSGVETDVYTVRSPLDGRVIWSRQEVSHLGFLGKILYFNNVSLGFDVVHDAAGNHDLVFYTLDLTPSATTVTAVTVDAASGRVLGTLRVGSPELASIFSLDHRTAASPAFVTLTGKLDQNGSFAGQLAGESVDGATQYWSYGFTGSDFGVIPYELGAARTPAILLGIFNRYPPSVAALDSVPWPQPYGPPPLFTPTLLDSTEIQGIDGVTGTQKFDTRLPCFVNPAIAGDVAGQGDDDFTYLAACPDDPQLIAGAFSGSTGVPLWAPRPVFNPAMSLACAAGRLSYAAGYADFESSFLLWWLSPAAEPVLGALPAPPVDPTQYGPWADGLPLHIAAAADLNGDGIQDYYLWSTCYTEAGAVAPGAEYQTSATVHTEAAISGRDGSSLWTVPDVPAADQNGFDHLFDSIRGVAQADLDGDGGSDFISRSVTDGGAASSFAWTVTNPESRAAAWTYTQTVAGPRPSMRIWDYLSELPVEQQVLFLATPGTGVRTLSLVDRGKTIWTLPRAATAAPAPSPSASPAPIPSHSPDPRPLPHLPNTGGPVPPPALLAAILLGLLGAPLRLVRPRRALRGTPVSQLSC